MPAYRNVTATIAAGATTSGEVALKGKRLVGMLMPAALTGTSLTLLTATASGGTFVGVTDAAGSPVTFAVAPGQYIAIDPAALEGLRYVKLVSNLAEAVEALVTVVTLDVA